LPASNPHNGECGSQHNYNVVGKMNMAICAYKKSIVRLSLYYY
jgi:hypothetical protein